MKKITLAKIICIVALILITMCLAGISYADIESVFLDSSSYMILEKNKRIVRIIPETTIAEFKQKFNQDEETIKVYKNSNSQEIVTEGYIKTGMAVKFDNVEGKYTLSVIGDLNEDGKMDQIDLNLLIKHVIGFEQYQSTDIKSISADVNCDGQINQIDITTLIRYIMTHELNVPEISKTAAPRITKNGTETNGWYNNDVEVVIEKNNLPEVESTVYRIIGTRNVDEQEINSDATIRLTENGEYNIIAYSYKNDGTRSEIAVETIKIDKDAPTLSVSLQSEDNEINVTADATDGVSGIKKYIYYIGSKNGDNIEYSQGIERQEGTYKFTDLLPGTEYGVKVEVEDNAGNKTIVQKQIQTKVTKITPEFTISKTSGTIEIDGTDTFTITYNGDGELGVNSSDTSVATVSRNNKTVTITGKKAGTATITVTAGEGTEYSAGEDKTYIVTVNKKTESLSLSATSGSLTAGESDTITITYNGDGELKAESDNNTIAVASISEKTVTITAKNEGTARIMIWALEGDKTLPVDAVTYTLTVTAAKTTPTLSFDETSGTMFAPETKVVTFDYDGDGVLTVSSSNSSVATVSVNASAKTVTITGAGPGTATITLSAAEGTTSLAAGPVTYTITVQAAAYEVSAGTPKYHTDLNAAIAACQSGGTITLLMDVNNIRTPGTFTKNVTFNLNGKTISGNCNIFTSSTANPNVTIYGSGTISSSSSSNDTVVPYGLGNRWSLDSITVRATGGKAAIAQVTGVTTVVNMCTTSGKVWVGAGSMRLTSCNITNSTETGLNVESGATADVHTCTIKGKNCGISNGGNLTVSDGGYYTGETMDGCYCWGGTTTINSGKFFGYKWGISRESAATVTVNGGEFFGTTEGGQNI